MSAATGLRAGDADRDRAVETLRTAAAEGRLTSDELEQRLETALGARTYAELDALVADLPAPRRPAPRPSPGGRRAELGVFAATAALMVAIWAFSGAGYFWPVWPILGWGLYAFGPARSWTHWACRQPAHRRRAQVGFRACRRNAS